MNELDPKVLAKAQAKRDKRKKRNLVLAAKGAIAVRGEKI